MKSALRIHWLAPSVIGLACLSNALAEELRDPTRPPQTSATSAAPAATRARQPARLEAVLFSADRAVAIVDGKLLRVGDWVGKARIVAISADSVHLTHEGRNLTLRLANQAMNVRRTAPSKDPQ